MSADLIQAALKDILAQKQDHTAGSVAYQRMERVEAALRTLRPQPQPQELIPADCDVRKILLRVDPGEDGEGVEVYARNVGEVEALLSELGDKEEEAYASQLALPAGPVHELSAAIKHVRAHERSLGRVVIGGEPSEVGLSFRVQQLGFAIDNLEQAFAKHASPSPAVAQPVADGTFVQPVPDHCDRITWRNRYYHLPPAAEANKLDDEALYKALATIRTCDLSGFPGDVIAMVDAALAAKGGAS